MDRAEVVHQNFLKRVQVGDLPELAPVEIDQKTLSELFRAQITSRHLDRAGRKMQSKGQGFYTIGSSGHEAMAGVAAALRPTDPAFLHYRDGAFQIARASQVPGQTPIHDMLLSFACSSDDPISGGRHKVLGSKALNIPPQTSTIASHLPKAVGAAYSIGLMRQQPPSNPEYAPDGIVFCSFGDASVNHSTAQGALNAAGWTAWQNAPLPLLFSCEDNGIGISVKSPDGWVAANLQAKPGLKYFASSGLDVAESYLIAQVAADYVRTRRKPAVLHLNCVRLYGHAGPDLEHAYRAQSEIDDNEAQDPLLYTAARMHQFGAGATDITDIYLEVECEVFGQIETAAVRPRLKIAKEVMASIIPKGRNTPKPNTPSISERDSCFGKSDLRALSEPQPMGKLINLGLTDLMLQYPEIIMVGEDIGKKGGVYGVTKGLQSRFGRSRVIDSLLDEQSILGMSLGLAHNGYIPMPEIQFLAYLHNAEDQIRGEGATLPFFSNGQFSNPMVLRIAGLGYQKGFGGHFHNDNSLAVLKDIPGIIIGCPSNGYDAVTMYREAVRLARKEERFVVMIEPIALYPMRDLQSDDGAWMHRYPDIGQTAPLGEVSITGAGSDLAIITYGNGNYLTRQALPDINGDIRIINLKWLAPLPIESLVAAIKECKQVLIVDECRRTGSMAETLLHNLSERISMPIHIEAAKDSFIATGPAYGATMPSRESITIVANNLLGDR